MFKQNKVKYKKSNFNQTLWIYQNNKSKVKICTHN